MIQQERMKQGQVAVLLLVFLTAILLHYLLLKKEGFEAAKRTPLTKENVQSLADQFVQDLLSQFLDFKKDALSLAKTDRRVKYRIVDTTNFLNTLNMNWPMVQNSIATFPYQNIPMLTFEDLQLAKDVFFYRVGMSTPKSATEPVTVADLDLFTSRILSISALLTQKAGLIPGGNDMIANIQTQTRIALENLKKLKTSLNGMKPTDIPLFRSDLYAVAFAGAATNFVIDPSVETAEIPQLEVGNLPAGKSMTDAIVAVIAPTPPVTTPIAIAPTPVSTALPPAQGLKFSELITTLISQSPTKPITQASSISLTTPTASTAADLVGSDEKLGLAGSNLDMRVRGLIKDELKKELDAVKKGPKDLVNDELAGRNTNLTSCSTPDARSDALAQGQWFRTAADSCPFAQGQQPPTQPPAPQPIDMNDQIRKDSIPCWGCSLK